MKLGSRRRRPCPHSRHPVSWSHSSPGRKKGSLPHLCPLAQTLEAYLQIFGRTKTDYSTLTYFHQVFACEIVFSLAVLKPALVIKLLLVYVWRWFNFHYLFIRSAKEVVLLVRGSETPQHPGGWYSREAGQHV
jgi:hypothetical protein